MNYRNYFNEQQAKEADLEDKRFAKEMYQLYFSNLRLHNSDRIKPDADDMLTDRLMKNNGVTITEQISRRALLNAFASFKLASLKGN